MDDVSRQLVRAIRGRRSQLQFSRRLGFKSDAVAEWEAGRRWPTAAGFLRACDLAGLDVADAIRRFQPNAAPPDIALSDAFVAEWLTALRGNQKVGNLAKRIDRSRYAVARWLSGQTRPRLPDFLRLIEAMTGRCSDLIALLVPIEQVPILHEQHTRTQKARRALAEEPWAVAILALLESTPMAKRPHTPVAIGHLLGIDPQRAAHCIDGLVAAGVLRRQRGRLEPTGDRLVVDMDAAPGLLDRQKRHWSEVAMQRLDTRGPTDAFGYSVFGIRREDLARVRELHLAYYRQVRALAAKSEPTDTVALLNLQLVDLTSHAMPEPTAQEPS